MGDVKLVGAATETDKTAAATQPVTFSTQPRPGGLGLRTMPLSFQALLI